ncbi:hypothetical protein ACP70R_011854 [Stipagrostis hirtigluma subsp. patula]
MRALATRVKAYLADFPSTPSHIFVTVVGVGFLCFEFVKLQALALDGWFWAEEEERKLCRDQCIQEAREAWARHRPTAGGSPAAGGRPPSRSS